MKISASKKTIRILSVCLGLLLFATLLLFYKDTISNGIQYKKWLTLDKYNELLNDCIHRKEGESIKLECNALLIQFKNDKVSDENICASLELILKDNKNTRPFSPCTDRKNLDTSNYTYNHIPDSYFPVVISFNYDKSGLFKYSLSTISIREMPYEQIQELKTKSFPDIAYMIRTQKDGIFANDHYYFVDVGLNGQEYPYISYIKEMTLNKIEPMNNKLKLTFKGKIKGEFVDLILEEEKFTFLSPDGERSVISIDNPTTLEIDKNYQLTFLSLPASMEQRISEIMTACKNSQEEVFMQILCEAGEERIKNAVIKDRDEYLDSLLDKSSNIVPHKLIPYTLSQEY